jgi:hypothetical protein
MKKTYAAPALVISGNVVRETLSGSITPVENGPTTKNLGAGGVGFYL